MIARIDDCFYVLKAKLAEQGVEVSLLTTWKMMICLWTLAWHERRASAQNLISSGQYLDVVYVDMVIIMSVGRRYFSIILGRLAPYEGLSAAGF